MTKNHVEYDDNKVEKMILTAAQNYMSTFQVDYLNFRTSAHDTLQVCSDAMMFANINRKVQPTISIMRFIDAHISTRHHKYLWYFFPHGYGYCCLPLSRCYTVLAFYDYGKVRYGLLWFLLWFHTIFWYLFALNVYLLKLDFNKLFFFRLFLLSRTA